MKFLEGMLIEVTRPKGPRFGVVRECKSFGLNRDDLVWADWRHSAEEALAVLESHTSVTGGGSLSYFTIGELERLRFKVLQEPTLKPLEDWL